MMPAFCSWISYNMRGNYGPTTMLLLFPITDNHFDRTTVWLERNNQSRYKQMSVWSKLNNKSGYRQTDSTTTNPSLLSTTISPGTLGGQPSLPCRPESRSFDVFIELTSSPLIQNSPGRALSQRSGNSTLTLRPTGRQV